MARRADAFAFSLLEIAREVASFVHGDFAAGRGDFADIVALFDTSVLCRAAVTEVMGAELENVSLRVYMVDHGRDEILFGMDPRHPLSSLGPDGVELSFAGIDGGLAIFRPCSSFAIESTDGPSFGIISSLHFTEVGTVTAQSLWGYRPTVPPPPGHVIADDPAFVVEFALPAPHGRLSKIDYDLGPARSGWTVDVTTQGQGWHQADDGVFEAEVLIGRVAVPVLDVWRAPTRGQHSAPSAALVEEHRLFIQNGHDLLEAFDGRLGVHALEALRTRLEDEEMSRQARLRRLGRI